ncbi:DEAD/DEAH box helicase [Rhizobium sp. YIM 134829]|uniref:DEAD/DEAH box helicase n=1 Tax=Rhizobium sp. YIM 134829 TaxID=3390453 RepID=UPI00397DD560
MNEPLAQGGDVPPCRLQFEVPVSAASVSTALPIDETHPQPSQTPPAPDIVTTPPLRLSASLIATRLLRALAESGQPLLYVARTESTAMAIARALEALAPESGPVLLPPWDCLPYDRILPSRRAMGRRMDALRVWLDEAGKSRHILIAPLDALLQRVPPLDVIRGTRLTIETGKPFDRAAFERFTEETGYLSDSVVDEPGEVSFREEMVEIFPAGWEHPMRIVLSEDQIVEELRVYDPETQRSVQTLDTMLFGPASELIGALSDGEEGQSGDMERTLFRHYGQLPSVLELLPPCRLLLAEEMDARLDAALDTIAEARSAQCELGGLREGQSTLYLSAKEWKTDLARHAVATFILPGAERLPDMRAEPAAPRAFLREELDKGQRVLVTGRHPRLAALLKRLEERLGHRFEAVERFTDLDEGPLFKGAFELEKGFIDREARLTVIAAADLFGHATETGENGATLRDPDLAVGDVVVHQDHGVGLLAAVETVEIDGVATDTARLTYHGDSSVRVLMRDFGRIWRYGSAPETVSLDRLHTDAWSKKRAIVSREIDQAARKLAKLARQRAATAAPTLVAPREAYARFALRFPFPETPDQSAAIEAVRADLASGRPMNRLICGDVGFGKTEIALRAAAIAALSGHQVIVLAPTTVLARQHQATFERRFAGTGKRVALLSRLVKPAQAKRVKAALKEGSIDIVVATSAVLARDVGFAKPGLMIIDEEHKFGARDKASIRRLSPGLHVLVMTATPIPRTLQQALIGLQDVSLLTTPPARRRPVRTFLAPFDPATARTALMREKRRDGQSFVVVPRIEDLATVEALLRELVPDLSLRIAHGKLPAAEVDEVMVGFAEGKGDILLSTNIIESGLDVPRANTILIWDAERFGLAQLHQLRGRVGRGRMQGIAYLTTPPGEAVSEETTARLSVLVSNDRLGAGLAISQQDLDLRGTGDLFGEDQAGHVKVIGTSLYQELLAAAVGGERAVGNRLFQRPTLRIGLDGRLPDDYVPDPAVRLTLYSRLLKAQRLSEVDRIEEEMEDRFGSCPPEVLTLLRLARLTVAAGAHRMTDIDGGPLALAFSFSRKPAAATTRRLRQGGPLKVKDGRLLLARETADGGARLELLETLFGLSGAQD